MCSFCGRRELAEHSFGLRITIYKSARLFASAGQRKLRASIANTPVEGYERCHRFAGSSSRAGGDQWLSPGIFYTGPQNVKKT
jgi:hypothetical protein